MFSGKSHGFSKSASSAALSHSTLGPDITIGVFDAVQTIHPTSTAAGKIAGALSCSKVLGLPRWGIPEHQLAGIEMPEFLTPGTIFPTNPDYLLLSKLIIVF
jgi:hypothetical protein